MGISFLKNKESSKCQLQNIETNLLRTPDTSLDQDSVSWLLMRQLVLLVRNSTALVWRIPKPIDKDIDNFCSQLQILKNISQVSSYTMKPPDKTPVMAKTSVTI